MKMNVNIGDELTWQKSFTKEDIFNFAKLSGDIGAHHLQPDEKGRFMVHGLLTASLPTKIGGEMNFIAKNITYYFMRPVYADEVIESVVKITKIEKKTRFYKVFSNFHCKTKNNKIVLKGEAEGVVYFKNI